MNIKPIAKNLKVLFRRSELPVSFETLTSFFGPPAHTNGALYFASEYLEWAVFQSRHLPNACVYSACTTSSKDDDQKFFQWLANNIGQNCLWNIDGKFAAMYRCGGSKVCNFKGPHTAFDKLTRINSLTNVICPKCGSDAFDANDGKWFAR